MMYNQLQLNAAAISSSGGEWVKILALALLPLTNFVWIKPNPW